MNISLFLSQQIKNQKTKLLKFKNMTLQITKENALKAFNGADEKGKQLLASLLGEQVFTPQKITDRVKTFEDACVILGLNPDIRLSVSDQFLPLKSITAFIKLSVIAMALNEGWEPDWDDDDQYKYYPWFKSSGPGLGLSYGASGYTLSNSRVGSRLCYRTRELAEYAGTQFSELYNDFLTI